MSALKILARQTRGILARCSLTSNLNVLSPSFVAAREYCDDIPRENFPKCRFPLPEKSEMEPDVKESIEFWEEKLGFIPNVHRTFARRPEEFRNFFKYYETVVENERGSLTLAEKELIVVATSAANNCLYCVVSHSAIHRVISKDPYVADQVAVSPAHTGLSPRERAIVTFALKVSKMEPIMDEDFKELELHDIDQEDAWDIGAITAFFALSNRYANFTGMRPNEEFYAMGRSPKK
ncbi:hypothetical protein CAPTEDRAFT_154691 [Capitella teleta]|uniref:Carboxymuconolactone decarboxylase-like domain-containing protein n=1 Tax=Capitella teleta TaxID=283909 RepID=R7TFX9_CAPTE|nr:hypothetical protein CAPTEDRAFT_154691 [Capitella teleta]|eukprot:ELT90446.1 hypothetical protein CAPTEDRAFT_154691 [Capitella teleta]